MSTPHKNDDVIDSRDVIARIEELQCERDALEDDIADEEDQANLLALRAQLADWDAENSEELEELKAMAEECEGLSDWAHGETLIADWHFETYAEQLAEDIGAINPEATWPNNCIDWERAARELKQDYTYVDFGGNTFWIRNC